MIIHASKSVLNSLIRLFLTKASTGKPLEARERGKYTKYHSGAPTDSVISSVDLERVLEGAPLKFNDQLLLLHHLHQRESPEEVMRLFHIYFWVQVHGIPTSFMSENVGRQLGNFLGEFISYNAGNNSTFWRSYMRIRVKMVGGLYVRHGSKSRYRLPTSTVAKHIGRGVSIAYRPIRKIR